MKTAKSIGICSVVLAVGLLVAGLAGCNDQKQPPARASAKVINSTCPIMGSTIDPADVPANLTREYKGKKIGFCCAGCPAKWDQLADEKKAALLAKMTKGG